MRLPEQLRAWVLDDPGQLSLVDKPIPMPGRSGSRYQQAETSVPERTNRPFAFRREHTFPRRGVAVLSHYMGCELSPEEIIADFRTFLLQDSAVRFRDEPGGARELRATGTDSVRHRLPGSQSTDGQLAHDQRRLLLRGPARGPRAGNARQCANPAAPTICEQGGLNRRSRDERHLMTLIADRWRLTGGHKIPAGVLDLPMLQFHNR
jgi:hypothetical protein